MRNRVSYEWGIEELDWYYGCGDDPDVVDSEFSETLVGLDLSALASQTHRLVLVVYIGNDDVGLQERGYAYPKNGVVPQKLTDTGQEQGVWIRDTPKRFQRELRAAGIVMLSQQIRG